MGSKCKRWVFTLNNPHEHSVTVLDLRNILKEHCDYAIFQLEKGENGTFHYQGYVHLKRRLRLAQLKNELTLPTAHFEQASGTGAQNKAYCSKDCGFATDGFVPVRCFTPLGVRRVVRRSCNSDDRYFRVKSVNYGSIDAEVDLDSPCEQSELSTDVLFVPGVFKEYFGPQEVGDLRLGRHGSGKGRRSDLAEACETLRTERSVKRVARQHPTVFAKYSSGLMRLAEAFAVPREEPPFVCLIFGRPGVGKTRYVVDEFGQEDAFFKEPGTRWWDGYDGHQTACLDDFVGRESIQLSNLLRWLDRYSVNVEVKGNFKLLVAKRIYVTTNIHPLDWYDYSRRHESYFALVRRFHQVMVKPSTGDGLVTQDKVEFFRGRQFVEKEDGPVLKNFSEVNSAKQADFTKTFNDAVVFW